MRPSEYNFNEEFELTVNDSTYYAEVKGYKYLNDFGDSYDTEIEKFWIFDEDNQKVSESHKDYYDLMEEILNRDYHVDYEPEGLDDKDLY